MKVLLDINVALDTLLERGPWHVESDEIWSASDAGRLTGYLSAVSVTTIFYLVDRVTPPGQAEAAVDACLKAFAILPVSAETFVAARAMPGRDFEDNVQIACALAAGLDAIVTRNRADFVHSPVRVMSPAELLSALAKP